MPAPWWSSWRRIRPRAPTVPKGLAPGESGGSTEQEQRELLRSLDDPRHLEFPRGFRYRATRAKFEQLVDLLDRAFACRTEVDRNIQDAGCHGRVIVPAGATRSGEFLTVMVSNFGDLALFALGSPASYSDEEVALLLDPRDRTRIDGALRALGYVVISDAVLWSRYDGPSRLYSSPGHPPTWWDRFFNYF